MTTRKRALTAQIKPETRNAIMDQLALAASTIIRQREDLAEWKAWESVIIAGRPQSRRWWHRFVPTRWRQ